MVATSCVSKDVGENLVDITHVDGAVTIDIGCAVVALVDNDAEHNVDIPHVDIAIAVKKLLREGTIRPEHLKVLTKYGFEQVPPHPHFGDSLKICNLWKEALSFLESILRKKGIVYCL